MQLELTAIMTAAPAVAPGRPDNRRFPGWTRLSEPGRKCDARWLHEASGWVIRHCGHPTALWPYFAVDPEHPGCETMTHNGKGFRKLEDGFAAIEAVLRGELVATDNACVPGVRRITTRGDLR